MNIFLDMDGVIADWPSAVSDIFRVDRKIAYEYNYPAGDNRIEMEHVLGISKSEMWAAIEAKNDFWETIPEYDYAKELVKMLKSRGDLYICTSHGTSHSAPSGKMKWLSRNKYKFGKNVCIIPNKHLLANDRSILIDDTPKQYNKFLLSGGYGILFPQPWNGQLVDDKLSFVSNQLDNILA
jgi:5'(3')-deoxyribonucleotidase